MDFQQFSKTWLKNTVLFVHAAEGSAHPPSTDTALQTAWAQAL